MRLILVSLSCAVSMHTVSALSLPCLSLLGCQRDDSDEEPFSALAWIANCHFHSALLRERIAQVFANPLTNAVISVAPGLAKLAEIFSSEEGIAFVNASYWFLVEVRGHPLSLLVDKEKKIRYLISEMQEHNKEIAHILEDFVGDPQYPDSWKGTAREFRELLLSNSMELLKMLPDIHTSSATYFRMLGVREDPSGNNSLVATAVSKR